MVQTGNAFRTHTWGHLAETSVAAAGGSWLPAGPRQHQQHTVGAHKQQEQQQELPAQLLRLVAASSSGKAGAKIPQQLLEAMPLTSLMCPTCLLVREVDTVSINVLCWWWCASSNSCGSVFPNTQTACTWVHCTTAPLLVHSGLPVPLYIASACDSCAVCHAGGNSFLQQGASLTVAGIAKGEGLHALAVPAVQQLVQQLAGLAVPLAGLAVQLRR